VIARVYIDTSVIGGCIDREFKEWSDKLFDEFISGKKIAVISDVTLDELDLAPRKVQNILKKVPDKYLRIVESNDKTENLAKQYILRKAVSEKFFLDALHIAIATYYNVTVLSSWNFRHIVNLDRIIGYNSVNNRLGYPVIEIRSPKDLLRYED